MSPVARSLAVTAALIFVATAPPACALDWDVRPDTGVAPDGAPPDATGAFDGSVDSDAPQDGGDSGAAACDALRADVDAKKPLARACQLGQAGQCTTTVKDQCDCDVVVRFANDPTTDAYVAAVAALRASCAPSCGECPTPVPSTSWACLQNASSTIECFP